MEGDALEDYAGSRYAVWSVQGCDSSSPQVVNGWLLMLNSVEYPIQVLIRQHAPDLAAVRENLLAVRPEHMRAGLINDVANSMLDYLKSLEDGGRVVARRWYVVTDESKAMELSSVMAQSGFRASRLLHDDLGVLLQACISGMGHGHVQDLYQARESSKDIELNERYMAVYDVPQVAPPDQPPVSWSCCSAPGRRWTSPSGYGRCPTGSRTPGCRCSVPDLRERG